MPLADRVPLDGLTAAAPPRLLLNPAMLVPLVSLNVTVVDVPLLRIARSVTLLALSASVEGDATLIVPFVSRLLVFQLRPLVSVGRVSWLNVPESCPSNNWNA